MQDFHFVEDDADVEEEDKSHSPERVDDSWRTIPVRIAGMVNIIATTTATGA